MCPPPPPTTYRSSAAPGMGFTEKQRYKTFEKTSIYETLYKARSTFPSDFI